MRKLIKKDKPKSSIDLLLVISVLSLTFIGMIMVYDSSVAIALRDFNDKYYYLREQMRWVIIGIISMFVVSKINYKIFQKFARPLFITGIGLLILVLTPVVGVSALGARRWISIGSFVFQPAELMKLILIVYLSSWLSKNEKPKIGPFLFIIAIIEGLIFLEPDMGTGIIILLIGLTMYFCTNVPVWHFLMLIPVMLGSLITLAVTSPYRLKRLMTFLNIQNDPLGASYQIRQALIAIGSGGLFGLGIGKSRQKYEYLPEANTDSIFAILAEETGFIGSLIFIVIFAVLIWRGFYIASRTSNRFGQLLAIGISSWLSWQVIINIFSMLALSPLTGVPLPLISYGGSSLIITLTAMGILLSVSKYIN